MVKVIPAILTDNLDEFRELLNRTVGVVDRVQVDFIDGVFANNKTLSPSDLRGETSKLNLDAHLMVSHDNVESYTRDAISAGFDRIICQVESINDQKWYLNLVKGLKAKAGLGLNLGTSVGKLDREVLNNLDVILTMSVPAGFGGQKFDEKVLAKIKALNEHTVCIDGGVTEENVGKIIKAGASEVSVGKRLFDGDLSENIKKYG